MTTGIDSIARAASRIHRIGKALTLSECRSLASEGVKFYFTVQYEFPTLACDQDELKNDRDGMAFRHDRNDPSGRLAAPRRWQAMRVKSGVVIVIVVTIFSQDTRIVIDTRVAQAMKDLRENLGVTHINTADSVGRSTPDSVPK